MSYTNSPEYRELTVEEQYLSFVGQCRAIEEVPDFFECKEDERRRELVQTIRDISSSPVYAELTSARFTRPSIDLPQPDPLVERIVRLMNKMPRRSA